ncbi:DUF2218 domain-containing protein [Streptomyces resistomycificus]|uniref:DUF2218 domain-containing protein n=1 Tax=Streptomyces resistomycificus TaxID=67356 RepID=UPI00099775FD|nr:DUF2218 domain-containing protein [Streptomyces resistomycificus]
MPRSEARVSTDRPHRYAKQLASHLGRRSETSWDEQSGQGRLRFQDGTGSLTAVDGALLLSVESEAEYVSATSQAKNSFLASSGSCSAVASSIAAALSQSLAYTSRPM